jgi:hypothetical protein
LVALLQLASGSKLARLINFGSTITSNRAIADRSAGRIFAKHSILNIQYIFDGTCESFGTLLIGFSPAQITLSTSAGGRKARLCSRNAFKTDTARSIACSTT